MHTKRARAVTITEAEREGYETPFTSETIGLALLPAAVVLAAATLLLLAIL